MSTSNGLPVTANIVTLYNNGEKVGEANVDGNGQWRAEITGLEVGQNSFQARVSDSVSNEWAVEVRPPYIDFTDFQDGSWRDWVRINSNLNYELEVEDGNLFGKITWIQQDYAGNLIALVKTFRGLVVGGRYTLSALIRNADQYNYMFLVGEGVSGYAEDAIGKWGRASLTFTASGQDVSLAVLYTGRFSPGDFCSIDNIGLARID